MKTAQDILTEQHGFHKSMMVQPSGLMWHAVITAMQTYTEELALASCKATLEKEAENVEMSKIVIVKYKDL